MNYSEASYFDGFHFAHIAARDEAERIKRISRKARAVNRDNARDGLRLRLRDFRIAA